MAFAEGLRLLENGESDLHCGCADPGRPLPAFLRRERFIELTAGIVAGDRHPLLTRRPSVRDLAGWPWIDYDAPPFTAPPAVPSGDAETSLDPVLDRLFRETSRRATTRLRAGAAALQAIVRGLPTYKGLSNAVSGSSRPTARRHNTSKRCLRIRSTPATSRR